jgi:N-carbamoylputrescine amidase
MRFTVACAQMAPLKAELQANLDKIASMIVQASGEGADLVVFPEAGASGYFLEGGVVEVALEAQELANEVSQRLKGSLAKPIDAVIGFYESTGGNLHNSAAYLEISGGVAKVLHVYRKFFLPTYGVFDEERFVNRGRELGVFETRLGRMGILICEDVWHSMLPALTALKGAQTIIVPSASPARGFSGEQIGNLDRYHRLLTAISEEHGVYSVNCQLSGFEGGKGLVGGSMIVDPYGKVIIQSPVQEEHLLVAPIDLELVELARAQSPLLADLQNAWPDVLRMANDC